jgi:hypothetical protein
MTEDSKWRPELIVESEDWGKYLGPALQDLYRAFPGMTVDGAMNCIKVLLNIAYMMGYERGESKVEMPQFIVGEE